MKIERAKEIFSNVDLSDKEALKSEYHQQKKQFTDKLENEKDNAIRDEMKKNINELNDAYILLQSSDVNNAGVLSIWPLIPLAVFIAFFWWALIIMSNHPRNHETTHDYTSTVYFGDEKQFELNHAQSKKLYDLIQSFPNSFNPITIHRGRSIVSRDEQFDRLKYNAEFGAVFFLERQKKTNSQRDLVFLHERWLWHYF